MSWGSRGSQDIGVAYSGTLWADISYPYTTPSYVWNAESVSVAAAGAAASISKYSQGSILADGSFQILSGADTAEVRAAVTTWWAGYNKRGDWICWATTAAVGSGMSPTVSRELTVNGFLYGPTQIERTWRGATEITAAFSLSLTGAYRRAAITQALPSDQSGLRHPAQRIGTSAWYGSEDTTVTATCGAASATGNYGLGSETDITWALGATLGISYHAAPNIHQDYGRITLNQGIGMTTPVALSLALWTFAKDADSGGAWIWRGSTFESGFLTPRTDANTYWKTVPSGNTISVQRCAGVASSAVSWGETATWLAGEYENHLYKQNKDRLGVTSLNQYTSYNDSAGHPFDIGLFKHYVSAGVRQTDAQVSVGPNWTPVAWQEQWAFGTPIPDDLFRVFTNAAEGYYCNLRKDWLVANNEDVPFCNPFTTHNLSGDSMIDIRQAVTFHDLVTPLPDPPWQSGWCTWGRVEIDLDKPPGTSGTRPSAFTGSGGVAVLGEVWTIGAGGGVVSRTLATRRRNRMRRFASHSYPTLAEVSHDFPLYTRANLAIAVTGDDPNWWDPNAAPHAGEEVGCALEDVTDWRGLSCVKATLTGLGTAPNLRLTYRTLSGDDPCYLGAEYNFGASGEATAMWLGQQVATIIARADAPAGTAVYDLAPNAGDAPLDLELVELVEFVFPAGAQEVTFAGWDTVPYDAANPGSEVRMRMAHLHATDLWGAEVAADGMPNHKPSYLYGIGDTERVEVGYKHTEPRQHNPDYQGDPDDPSALKTLARWYNEQTYAETLVQPTWNQAAIDAALKDVDDNVLGTPVWGDYDEDGFCLHVGLSIGDYLTYCDCILQGGVRGIVKQGGKRKASQAAGVKFYYSDDAGTTKTLIREVGTGYAGEYRVGAGREKAPHTYYVNAIALGGFVNNEERWSAARIVIITGGQKVAMFLDPAGLIPWTAWIDGDGAVKLVETDSGQATPGTVRTVDASGDYDSVYAVGDSVNIWVDVRDAAAGTLWRFYSTDKGETWTGPVFQA